MGHREALLAGARQCLYDRGYGRTTARDIVAASGTNLASIGYHFGSKEALLAAALVEALAEWGNELEQRLGPVAGEPDPMVRMQAVWAAVIESVRAHRRLWMASYDAFVQMERVPEVRATLATAYESARAGLASMLLGAPHASGDPGARTVGAVQLAVLSGLATQWLLDPDSAPSASEVTAGLSALLGAVSPSSRLPDPR